MHPFTAALLSCIGETRQSVVAEPNIDTWRFGPFPGAFNRFDDRFFRESVAFLAANDEALTRMADAFADDASRELLKAVMAYRVLGPRHVRLPTNAPRYWQRYHDAATWRAGPSGNTVWPFEMEAFAGSFRGVPLAFEGWLGSIVFSFLAEQYFFHRGVVAITPEAGDYVIDAGGCFGDTALAFAIAIGAAGRIYSFEPIPRLREVFLGNMARNAALGERIALSDRAISDFSGRSLDFADLGAGSRPQSGGAVRVGTIAIDDFVRDQALPRVDFIKMDIEGSEREALRGAAETIRRFKPKLAISAYHRPDDLLVLPALIREIEPSYALYFDHYTIHAEESVVFGTPR